MVRVGPRRSEDKSGSATTANHVARHFASHTGEVTKSIAFADRSSLIELMQARSDRLPPCLTRSPVMRARQ